MNRLQKFLIVSFATIFALCGMFVGVALIGTNPQVIEFIRQR